jgi:hypothetical protein
VLGRGRLRDGDVAVRRRWLARLLIVGALIP